MPLWLAYLKFWLFRRFYRISDLNTSSRDRNKRTSSEVGYLHKGTYQQEDKQCLIKISFSALWVVQDLQMSRADSKDSDQTLERCKQMWEFGCHMLWETRMTFLTINDITVILNNSKQHPKIAYDLQLNRNSDLVCFEDSCTKFMEFYLFQGHIHPSS